MKTVLGIILLAFSFLFNLVEASSAKYGAIASAHPLATQAGMTILKKGGNAFDAAVAVSAALAVVEPTGSGLGGGGFWLLHRASDGFEVMVDGREKAPLSATKDMYLNQAGQVRQGLSTDGPLAAGIPGMPAALVYLAENFGRLPLMESLQPAILLAEEGFPVGEKYRRLATSRLSILQKWNSAASIFLHDYAVPDSGWILKQPDLSKTLQNLGKFGRNGFYAGEIAGKLVDSVRNHGGIWSQQDLEHYQVATRVPVYGEYGDIKITSSALPSSGGIVLMQALNILSGYDLKQLDSIKRKHLVIEALRRAYHDRALYLGDTDFVEVPVARLISTDYAAGLRSSIRLDRTLASSYLSEAVIEQAKGDNTSHFSIIDTAGNKVAATLSINFPFGSGFVAEGTGVLLNDEMDDFVSLPGAMNGYGLVGGSANAIAPGKRMLSSMTPTFIEDENRIGVLGTPGGSRIISMVLLAILDFAEGNGPASWVSVPRFHHQYLPDAVQFEPNALSDQTIEGLKSLGHRLSPLLRSYGDMQAVMLLKNNSSFEAASDPRGEGKADVE